MPINLPGMLLLPLDDCSDTPRYVLKADAVDVVVSIVLGVVVDFPMEGMVEFETPAIKCI